MNYLTLEHVSKSYGEKILFREVNLQISQGQKVALVAKNGMGKSTLLRVIAGEESGEGEQSRVFLAKDVRIGYLTQEPDFIDTWSVLETIFYSENPQIQAVRNYETALLHPDREADMQTALAQMDDLKAWDFEAKIKEILFKLNITDLEQKVGSLSGGQRKRLALARLLIDEPAFIILDEPTNHLDLEMIEWLEEYLQQPNLTLFMVTHDRYFLERVCNYIVELDNGTLHKYNGNYSEFLEKKASRHENEATEVDKARKLMRRELEWVRRMPKARSTKAKSRLDAFEDIKEKANQQVDHSEIQIDIKGARLGSKILEAHTISKRYEDKILVDGFSYKFKKNERVGIVGKNGVGKTTLLRMLTKEIPPDTGKVVVGDTVQFGHYTQEGIQLTEDKRVIDVITDIAEYIPLEKGQKLTASGLLERFLFDKKKQQVYVSQLSGGERRRLHLLAVLMGNPNFLILDEPTNDLDIITLNVLEDFLVQFPGCILIVTHDRFFMDKVVDHLFAMEGDGKVRDFNGTYIEYREQQRLQEEAERQQSRINRPAKPKADKKAPSGLNFEQRKEMNRLEKEISKLEARKTDIHAAFTKNELQSEDIQRLSRELSELEDQLEEKELRWMELAELD